MLFSDSSGPIHTVPAEQRDYPEWHHGRQHYALWSIPVTCPLILQRIQWARDLLSDWLHPDSQRQAHITLFVCGFEASQRRYDDDFTPDQFEAQRRVLQSPGVVARELQVGGLDSFSSAAILRVHDPHDSLPALRRKLARHGNEIRNGAYIAHLTVGLYRQRIEIGQWRRRVARHTEIAALPLPVHAVDYCSYQAAQMQGPLTMRHHVPLYELEGATSAHGPRHT